MRVLHIEDEDYAAYIVKEALRDVSVTLAASLAEALPLLREQRFDVLLVDLNLPDSRGLDTLAILSRFCKPIVVLSGVDDDDVVSCAARLGAEGYVRKSELLHVDLMQHLRSACGPRRRLFAAVDIAPLKRYLACPSCASLAVA